ncbi:MAG: hypothetical protein JWM34_5311 [Ilumatobacteraceae bacterium]|nr:hypothetical protein [Ilumatobacteraceae bacterium]
MLSRPNCLTSASTFLAASPAELAAAVLFVAFGALPVTVGPTASGVDVFQATAQLVGALDDLKPQSAKWFEALDSDAVQQIRLAMLEGVLFAEQRLCLSRESTLSSGHTTLVLLRRGQALLATGDTATYLG